MSKSGELDIIYNSKLRLVHIYIYREREIMSKCAELDIIYNSKLRLVHIYIYIYIDNV